MEKEIKPKTRLERLEEVGLLGCLNDTGVTSENYKEFIYGSKRKEGKYKMRFVMLFLLGFLIGLFTPCTIDLSSFKPLLKELKQRLASREIPKNSQLSRKLIFDRNYFLDEG